MIKEYTIESFTSVITGGTPSTIKEEYWKDGKIPWLNSGELQQDIVNKSSNFITELGLKNSSTKLLPKDTILIALTGTTTGKVGYLTFEACANQSVTGILPSEKHIPKYLYYYLNSIRNKVINDAYGGAQPHISQAYVKKIKIPLPPIETQKRIGQILDDADELCKKTEQLIKEYDVLIQSIFLDMFGDPIKNPKGWKLEKLISLSPIVKKTISPENILTDTKYVGLDSIEKNTGNINEIQKVEKGELKSNKYIFSDKNILYGKLRPYLNKVANPSFSGICSTDIIVFLPNNSMSNKQFITTFLRGKWFVEWANLNTSGANLPRLDLSMLSKHKIICPPLELQNQFAEKINLIEKQKELAKQELKESEDLFNCLLQKAFKGELV